MPFISRNDLHELIELVRELTILEQRCITNPNTMGEEQLASLQGQLASLKHKFMSRDERVESKDSQCTFQHNPNQLFDTLKKQLNLRNDAALSRILGVAPPVVSKIRSHRLPVGPSMLINIHEVSGISIKEIRALMGDTRKKFEVKNQEIKS